MPELVTIDKKKAAVEAVLREALPRLKVDLPPAMKEKAAKFAAGAFDCLLANPNLMEAAHHDPQRLRAVVIEAARNGLWIGPTMAADAHLVIFKDKGTAKIQLITNYRGLSKVAYNTGVIEAINTGTVREGDIFDWDEGSDPFVKHRKGQERGAVLYAWASIRLKGSATPIVKVKTSAEIETVRSRAPGGNSDAWRLWFDEQAEKTVLKSALKRAPRSEELARVLELDDHAMAGKEQRFQAEVTNIREPVQEAVGAPEKAVEAQEEEPPAEVTGEAQTPAKLRSRCAMMLKGMGVESEEQRHAFIKETFAYDGGLNSMPEFQLPTMVAYLKSDDGLLEVKAWLEKQRAPK